MGARGMWCVLLAVPTLWERDGIGTGSGDGLGSIPSPFEVGFGRWLNPWVGKGVRSPTNQGRYGGRGCLLHRRNGISCSSPPPPPAHPIRTEKRGPTIGFHAWVEPVDPRVRNGNQSVDVGSRKGRTPPFPPPPSQRGGEGEA
eukprot:scaffold177_cov334-Pavlova_lutheri.AAC.108